MSLCAIKHFPRHTMSVSLAATTRQCSERKQNLISSGFRLCSGEEPHYTFLLQRVIQQMNFSRKEVEPECHTGTSKHICCHKMRATRLRVQLMFYHTQQQILNQTHHHPYAQEGGSEAQRTLELLFTQEETAKSHTSFQRLSCPAKSWTESRASTLLTCEETSRMFGGRQSLLGGLSRSPKGQGIQPDACNAPRQKAVVTSYHWA